MADAAQPLSWGLLMDFAKQTDAKKQSPAFSKDDPSGGWWRHFKERHRDLSLQKPGVLDGARASLAHKSVIRKFLKQVEDIIIAKGISDPAQFHNTDETAFGKKDPKNGTGVFQKVLNSHVKWLTKSGSTFLWQWHWLLMEEFCHHWLSSKAASQAQHMQLKGWPMLCIVKVSLVS